MKKVRIKRFTFGSIIIALVLSVVFVITSIFSINNYIELDHSSEQYIECEKSAQMLQKGSDILTEQCRLFVMTGEAKYMEGYFQEANVTRHRDKAVANLKKYFSDTQLIKELQSALSASIELMNTEFYAMKLAADYYDTNPASIPEEVSSVVISSEDKTLSKEQQLDKAHILVSDNAYQSAKETIAANVNDCMDELLDYIRERRDYFSITFRNLYLSLELGMMLLIVLLIGNSVIVRKLIVNPLVCYNKKIECDEIVPLIGAAELQTLGETYNKVFKENQETQRIIKHEAEHDALSGLLNKGSFDRIFSLYSHGKMPFAFILLDIDNFKHVNDTYGHIQGDREISRVAGYLKKAFRSTDYVFRIGGDEFCVIMVDVPSELKPMVEGKLKVLKENILKSDEGICPLTLSIGVAFSDLVNSPDTIFETADKALYCTKRNGKDGVTFAE